jgi:phage regulator Rha-like protein
MSNLSVIERNGALVVDSRLIAQDLGIEHRVLLQPAVSIALPFIVLNTWQASQFQIASPA